MQSNISLKRSVLIGSIVGIVFFLIIFILNLLPSGQVISYTKPASPYIQGVDFPQQVSSSLPVRLKIPKIKVDAAFEYVGLASDGAMDVPKERANVAWFNLGPRPGEAGSSVIAGHYGRQNRKGSAFDRLHRLRKGDKLYVEDDKGQVTTFVVVGSRRYDPFADASDVFSSNDGKSHLNLVTCEGEWDKASESYSRRLIVFTDKEID